MTVSSRLIIWALVVSCVVGVFGGLGIGKMLWFKPPRQGDTIARPEVRVSPGTLVLGQVTMKAGDIPNKPPIPKGETLKRIIRVTVRDTTRAHDTLWFGDEAKVCPPCSPVEVDLALTHGKLGDRVTASTPTGEVLAGMDIPLYDNTPPAERPCGVSGIIGTPTTGKTPALGVNVSRDFGPARIGAGVIYSGAASLNVQVGIRF